MVENCVDTIPSQSRGVATTHEPVLRASSAFAQVLWRAFDNDALTAFRVATASGRIIHTNQTSMSMLLSRRKGSKPSDVTGRYWHELLPARMAKERLEIASAALADGRARYLRSIYNGVQVLTRYDPVGTVAGLLNDEPLVICTSRQEPRVLAGEVPADLEIAEPEHHVMGPLSSLTPRELQVLALIGEGMSIQEIAQWTGRSVHTLNDMRRSIGRKLHADDRVELARIAQRAGLTFTDGRLRGVDSLARVQQRAVAPLDRPPIPPAPQLRSSLLGSPACVGALWRAAFEDVFTGAQVVRGDTTVLLINQALVTMLLGHGVRAEQCVGRKWAELAPPELVRERERVLESVLLTGKERMTRGIHLGLQVVTRFDRCDPIPQLGHNEPIALCLTRRVSQDTLDMLPARAKRLLAMPRVHRLGRLAALSRRELEVLALIGEGLSNKQIAARLHRTEDTIEDHRNSLGKKLGEDDRVRLAAIARRAGLRLEDAEESSV